MTILNIPNDRSDLLDAAVDALISRLPPSWEVQKQVSAGDPEAADLIIKTPNSMGQVLLLVEVKVGVSARDVEALMGGPWRRWRRQMGNQPILLVAPYIGPRVRELLTEESVNYLDLTGNIRISLDHPGIFIAAQGASQDPGATKPRTRMRGAKVGALVRLLADVRPPYTGAQIARAANLNEGYLSRLLDTFADEGLINRESFGPVTDVDWPAMLQRRARAVDLFRKPGAHRYIARQGTAWALESLRGQSPPDWRPPTVTGSFAAARLAPVAAPTLLVLYTTDPTGLAEQMNLLPAEAGADTILIRPDNDVAFERADIDGGIAWAAPSQVAVDCLAGSGRMPSEGEALIEWMRSDENMWRYPSIQVLPVSALPELS